MSRFLTTSAKLSLAWPLNLRDALDRGAEVSHASFDFEAQPSIDPKQIRDLAASRWIAKGDNVLLLGPPGVGKTYLSIALGREAILAGYTAPSASASRGPVQRANPCGANLSSTPSESVCR